MRTFAVVALLLVTAGCKRAVDAAPASEIAAPAPPRTAAYTHPDGLGLSEGLGVPVGEAAPHAQLEDAEGAAVQLADTWSDGAVLVVFYRGGWCPFCNHQIHDLTEAWPAFQERGVTPVVISVDRVDEAARTTAAYDIPFPVLSDPDLRAHEAFRVVHQATPEEAERLIGMGLDIEASSGRDHHRFAVPSMFLVDSEGVVRWAHADPAYKVRPSVAQVLAAIDGALR